MNRTYLFTKNNGQKIAIGGFVSILLCAWGISMITTDYKIETNLPLRKKLTEDFLFFENNYAGFRPVEFAVFTKGDYLASDFEVLQEMDKIECFHASVRVFFLAREQAARGGSHGSVLMVGSVHTALLFHRVKRSRNTSVRKAPKYFHEAENRNTSKTYLS